MSEENIESVDAPESTTEETTSQTQQQPEFDKDKFFRGAYNEGKSKVERDMIGKFSEILGNDVNTLDDAFSLLSNKMQPVQEDKGEADKLRELLQQYQEQAEAAKEQLALNQMENRIGSEFNSAFSALAIPSTWLIIPCIPSVKSKALIFVINTCIYFYILFIHSIINRFYLKS